MNAISLEYEMLERMNAMGLISDAYLRESKTRLDNKNKEQIGKIVTDLTSSSGSEMRNRVAATLMNHHAPTYQIYGCLEAMLKKFGSIYSVQIAPSRPGEYLWYWTICNANHIPESTAKAILIKIREELNQRQTPVTEMNILVLLFSEYLEKQGKAPQSFNKSLLRAF